MANLRNRWFLVLLMFFCYPVVMIPRRGGCQLEKVKLLSATYICRKAVFLSISLSFTTAKPHTTKATGPSHSSWLCPQPPKPLPAPVMGRILKHLLPLWVITPKARCHTCQTLSAPASWHKSGKTQMWAFSLGNEEEQGTLNPPTFIQWWIPPNLGKGFRWQAAQMVTKVYKDTIKH